MAWSDPGEFISGQILTAAQMNSVREAMFLGQATFTNEAARDAAIPATGITLQEGMRAYLSAATEPSGTGMTITGITTVYDGAAWTTISPITGLVTTSQVTSSTSYQDLATVGPTVVLRTGTSALVTVSATIDTAAASRGGTMSFAVSGATTIAAIDDNSVFNFSNSGQSFAAVSRTFLLTGLTAGVNTFTSKYKQQGGATNISRRSITVQGLA
jgi:hypothetical protein